MDFCGDSQPKIPLSYSTVIEVTKKFVVFLGKLLRLRFSGRGQFAKSSPRMILRIIRVRSKNEISTFSATACYRVA